MSRAAGNNMALGGLLSLVRLTSGIVRVKIIALALGVGGVGVYALLLQLYATGVAVASMSLAIPIINLGRPAIVVGNVDKAGSIAGTALAVVAVNLAILLLLAAGLGGPLFHYIGVDTGSGWLLWPIVVAIAVGAVSNAFWEGMSFLCDRFDIYVRVGIIGAAADTLFVASAAWMWGLKGAIVAMPLGTATMFIAYVGLVSRDATARAVLRRLSVRLALLSSLLGYAAMMFATVALTNVGLTLLRSRVLVEAGVAANGYLQTVTALASYILAFVMTGFWGHLHARAAAEGDTPAVRDELDKSLRLGLMIAFSGCGAAAVLAPYVIPLFYSRAFGPASRLMLAYMPGELCFQLLSMLSAYQLTVNRRRAYLTLNLGYVGLLVAFGLLLIPGRGASGYVIAHVVAAAVMVGAAGTMSWRDGQVTPATARKALALLLILALVCAALFTAGASGDSLTIIAVALVPFVVSGVALLRLLLSGRSMTGV